MTRVAGYRQLRVPCCGKVYIQPNYLSMNFMADEHWTDGWRSVPLMPNDTGLRRCHCGHFLLIWAAERLGLVENAEGLPFLPSPEMHQLEHCLTSNPTSAVEIAARTELWWNHNHAYRKSYRIHRAAEEQATRQAWEAAHPDRRIWGTNSEAKQRPNTSGHAMHLSLFRHLSPQTNNCRTCKGCACCWRNRYLTSLLYRS